MKKLLILVAILWSVPAFASSVNLAWDHPAPETVAGYKLHFGSASRTYTQEVDVGNKLTASLDVGLGDARRVFITASAYDAAKNKSGYSNEVVWEAPDDLPPDAPMNLRIEVQMSRNSDGTYQIATIKVQ